MTCDLCRICASAAGHQQKADAIGSHHSCFDSPQAHRLVCRLAQEHVYSIQLPAKGMLNL